MSLLNHSHINMIVICKSQILEVWVPGLPRLACTRKAQSLGIKSPDIQARVWVAILLLP